MGYLVLQSPDDKSFEVIDGQQRLTTVTIVILAILKHLQRLVDAGKEPAANAQRVTQIRQTYIGYLDPVTLVSRPKLVLNRNNNSYFQDYLVPLGHLPRRGFRASEHLLRKAFEWFDKRIDAILKQETGDQGRRLAQLVEDLSDRLFFTVITVTDELNAYKVFETLNARGVRLSATDLLKNTLFSVLEAKTTTNCAASKGAGSPCSGAWARRAFRIFCACTGTAAAISPVRRSCSRPFADTSRPVRPCSNSCATWTRISMLTWR